MKIVLTLALVLSLGCAFGVGTVKTTATNSEVPEEVVEQECTGLFGSFGQSDACGIEGEAISPPGFDLVKGAFCGLLSYLGRTPVMCEVSDPDD